MITKYEQARDILGLGRSVRLPTRAQLAAVVVTRRPRRNGGGAEYRVAILAYLRERDGDDCGECGYVLSNPIEIDHIIPVYQGGQHRLDNFRLLHAECNAARPRR